MKYAHALKFNTNPEWIQAYLDYDKLKRLIYNIERVETEERYVAESDRRRSIDEASLPLLREHSVGRVSIDRPAGYAQRDFRECLDAERNKVVNFSQAQYLTIMEAFKALEAQLERLLQQQPNGDDQVRDNTRRRIEAEGRVVDLYNEVHDLIEYRSMNREGFRKILKKHDKVTALPLMHECMHVVIQALDGKVDKELEKVSSTLVSLYMRLSNSSLDAADTKLKQQRTKKALQYQRPTVWRDMVALERHTGANVRVEEHGDAAERKRRAKNAWKATFLAAAIACFMVLLCIRVFEDPAQNKCFAMVLLLSALWCSEALPLYVTSMLVPALTVVLRIVPDHSTGQPMPAPKAADHVFKVMFSPVIMLLLGGFAIAGALSKHFVAKAMAVSVMARVRKPSSVVLASMFIATFSSMWISNVAAPVLCYALVQPILRRERASRNLVKSIVMGIAMASNVGGMTSPISSPQNIFAIAVMASKSAPPNWLDWFTISLPVSVLINLSIWRILILYYKPDKDVDTVPPLRASTDPINATQVIVVLVSGVTVLLWCANTALAGVIGNQGIVAILPLAIFFGSGILDKDDFNNFLWHVVMLAQGGLVLSSAVKECGILALIAEFISRETAGVNLWGLVAIFCFVVAICTTFISHTVGAMVILPVVKSVGKALPVPHPRLLVMTNVLMCSGAMGLPVSGFPNMTASALDDGTGIPYAEMTDFLVVGIASTVVSWVVVVTVGFSLSFWIGY